MFKRKHQEDILPIIFFYFLQGPLSEKLRKCKVRFLLGLKMPSDYRFECHLPMFRSPLAFLILTKSYDSQKIFQILHTRDLLQVWLLAFGNLTTQKIKQDTQQLEHNVHKGWWLKSSLERELCEYEFARKDTAEGMLKIAVLLQLGGAVCQNSEVLCKGTSMKFFRVDCIYSIVLQCQLQASLETLSCQMDEETIHATYRFFTCIKAFGMDTSS